MSIIIPLREQHRQLVEIASNIRTGLDVQHISGDARTVHGHLSDLVNLLRVHLTSEDRVLYPRLLESRDRDVRETAERFVAALGGLATSLAEHSARWPSLGAIQNGAADFVPETCELLDRLEERIRNEECVLYPLIDR